MLEVEEIADDVNNRLEVSENIVRFGILDRIRQIVVIFSNSFLLRSWLFMLLRE